MKKFFNVFTILIIVFIFRSPLKDISNNLISYVQGNVNNLLNKIDNEDEYINNSAIGDENNVEESVSDYNGSVSFDNYSTIKLGESVKNVISKMGEPNKKEGSEYGFKWYVYNQDIDKFCMIGISKNKVVALFSNTMNSCESNGIKLGDVESKVKSEHKLLDYRRIKNTRYILNEKYYNLIKTKSSYITVFYDSFEDNKVVGIQIIGKKTEENMAEIYTSDESVTTSFENINRYLINEERSRRGLNMLSYDENATLCARAHSKDMRDQDYFSHTNLKNQSPFDRMIQYGINYQGAAENIAAGQTSAIFAHYALMNSEGHRVNILGNYRYIGVGVVFGGSSSMYLTQNFYR